jgi:Mn2+/Fe2+ NRAMP family transporter
MKKILEVFLSILTAMGGFVEVGELVFAVNAGAKFGYSLLWIVLLGTIGIIVYGEMVGRIAAQNQQPVFYLIRERVGYAAGLVTLLAANAVCLLTCAAEIGGISLILKLLFGGPYRLLVLCSLIFLMLSVWFLSFQSIERVFGLLGLFMLVFVLSAIQLHPNWSEVAKSFVANVPQLLPYETYFYSSGAIEDGWNPSDITMNRIIAIVGFVLGSVLAIGLVLIGAQLFHPAGIEPQLPGSAALGPVVTFGKWGLLVALLGMFFAFSGAAIENALSGAYNLAQFLGWPWGKFRPPKSAARFNLSWIVIFILATVIIITGVDPVQVVEYSIIAAVVILPLTYLPTLLAAQDKEYMGSHVNGWLANTLGWFYLIVITIAALAAVPLLIITHGGEG